jgi:hypothetical protein
MYVAVAETFWLQGNDLYGALDDRILKGLEWSYRYNLSAWEPSGFTDAEGEATFENGAFYRARHRSGRWRSLAPSPKLRGALGTEGAPRECAYAHYRVRMGLGEDAVTWLKKGLDEMNARSASGGETWGAPPHWFYEWSGWGTLMKRRTQWMRGDPPNGIHRLPCRIAAKDADVNHAREMKPSYTVASASERDYLLSVSYRSSSGAKIAFSCDKSPATLLSLPPCPSGATVDGGTIRVPAGASVIRWVLVPGSGRADIRSFALKEVR